MKRFTPTLQHGKSLLYNKEYLAAFATEGEEGENWGEVYFARWTPARTVLYERAFRELDVGAILGWETDVKEQKARAIEAERRRRETKKQQEDENQKERPVQVKAKVEEHEVIMIGAGAGAEVIALGCILGSANYEIPEESKPKIKVQAIDQGSWGELAREMDEGMKEEWKSLTEAGEGGKTKMELEFVQGDLLAAYSADPNAAPSPLPPLNLDLSPPKLKLVTICLTVTELLLQSRPSTLRFLSTLTASAPKDSYLLIIESASLALFATGTSGRIYNLGQLLDLALCGGAGGEAKWEISQDGKGMHVKLEHSRVVLRLYRQL
ncbi:hypothetical protein JCM5353_008116 [Sporobolomyces roseus]